MRDLFLADAHLHRPDDPNYQTLLRFLDSQRGRIRTLFLLGDMFDFWVGYRHVVFSPYVPFLEALRRVREEGAEIVCVEGNHDFHLGPYFAGTLGCRILPDGGAVELGGQRIFVAHGDLVNPADTGYRVLRRILRSPPMRLLMSVAPPDLTWRIARRASDESRKKHGARRERWVPAEMLREHARRRFAEGYGAVVTGHFHAPLLEETPEGTIVALGDWITQLSYAAWEDGTFSLHTYRE